MNMKSDATILLPQKPFKVFFTGSLLWLLAIYLIRTLVFPQNVSLTAENSWLATIFSNLVSLGISVITIFSSSILTNQIIKKASYDENIKSYNYILYYVSSSVVGWISTVISFSLVWIFPNLNYSLVFIIYIINSLSFVITYFLQSAVVAKMLEALVIKNNKKSMRIMKAICALAIIGTAIAFGFVLFTPGNTIHMIGVLIIKLIIIFIIVYGILIGGFKNKELWLKKIPVFLIIGYNMLSLLANLIYNVMRDII